MVAAGRDVLRGGDGDDTLDASGGSAESQSFGDIVLGGTGSNTIIGHADAYNNYLAGGVDVIYDNVAGTGGVTINVGANGSGTTTSANASVVSDTFTYADHFEGTQDSDIFNGSDGGSGPAQDFESWVGEGGNDTINGNGGFDSVRYDLEEGTGGVDVNLATGIATDTFGDTDSLSGIEGVTGTDQNDTLTGDAMDNRFEGRGGADTLIGGAGDDTLYGGYGDDTINGGADNDRMWGDMGDDVIATGGSSYGGGDVVFGSNGNDTFIYTGAGAEGSGWNDLVYAYEGAITVDIDGAANTGTVSNISGTDTLVDVANALSIRNDGFGLFGSSGADTYNINPGPDGYLMIFGGFGADTYNLDLTSNGTVRLDFSGNWDEWRGATDALVINLETGVVQNDGFGWSETITVTGDSGRFELYGTHHADSIIGSTRDEFFISGGGNDTIDGAGGQDVLSYDRREASSGINANLATGVVTGAWNGVAFTQSISNIERLYSTNFDDVIVGSDGADELWGADGDDSVSGGVGNDTLVASFGNDDLDGGLGDDLLLVDLTGFSDEDVVVEGNLVTGSLSGQDVTGASATLASIEAIDILGDTRTRLTGDAGDNTLNGGDGADTLIGGDGDDFLFGGDSEADLRDVIYAGDGNDRLDGGHGNDELHGGNGTDTVLGGFGNDTLIGNAGDDVIAGGPGSDAVFGGPGNDTINGGFGFDRINGGDGADRFFHTGARQHASDWIQDYDAAEGDVLVFGDLSATRDDFHVTMANTPRAGADDVAEAFVIYRPTDPVERQIMWALVDGDGNDSINIQLNGQIYDLLA